MLTARDITGLMALPPTTVREGAEPFGPESTVDLDEAARVAKQLIADGVSSIGLCGTTGECATLTWSEKREFYAVARDTVEQMREVRDLGLDGAFVGLPLWQTPTVENAVGFHADLSSAVPDLAV